MIPQRTMQPSTDDQALTMLWHTLVFAKHSLSFTTYRQQTCAFQQSNNTSFCSSRLQVIVNDLLVRVKLMWAINNPRWNFYTYLQFHNNINVNVVWDTYARWSSKTLNKKTDRTRSIAYDIHCLVMRCIAKITAIHLCSISIYTVSQKNRTPATFCNNSNSPGSIAIDFDKNNR